MIYRESRTLSDSTLALATLRPSEVCPQQQRRLSATETVAGHRACPSALQLPAVATRTLRMRTKLHTRVERLDK